MFDSLGPEDFYIHVLRSHGADVGSPSSDAEKVAQIQNVDPEVVKLASEYYSWLQQDSAHTPFLDSDEKRAQAAMVMARDYFENEKKAQIEAVIETTRLVCELKTAAEAWAKEAGYSDVDPGLLLKVAAEHLKFAEEMAEELPPVEFEEKEEKEEEEEKEDKEEKEENKESAKKNKKDSEGDPLVGQADFIVDPPDPPKNDTGQGPGKDKAQKNRAQKNRAGRQAGAYTSLLPDISGGDLRSVLPALAVTGAGALFMRDLARRRARQSAEDAEHQQFDQVLRANLENDNVQG